MSYALNSSDPNAVQHSHSHLLLHPLQAPEVQVLEPALCLFDAKKYQALYTATYQALSLCAPITLVTFYDDVGENFPWVSALPVKAISMDFCGVVCP